MKRIIRGVAVYDLHYPHHNQKLWKSVLKFLRDFKPDIFLFGGDNLNMDAVNHWLEERNQKRKLEGKRIMRDYEGFKKEILDPLEKVLGASTRKIWLNGNHEDWIQLAIDRNPQGEGYWEIEYNLRLKERGWEVYEYGKAVKIGKLYFIHGEYTNKYHAQKTVDIYERNIVYGHNHTLQVYTKITAFKNEPHLAMSCPELGELNPEYMKNRSNSWLQGFLVFYLYKKGYFNLYPVVCINSQFVSPDGKMYG